ncbi:MAG: BadF/BadG/BcrA/BcrD ATPase family protein [Calditrichia bacterium]
MYFLGVDGGGTKTAAILTDLTGSVVRRTRSGSGNVAMLDRGSVAQLVKGLLDDLLQGEPAGRITYATLGFAGGGGERPRSVVSNLLNRNGVKNFSVLTDAMNLYLAAFNKGQGILLSAGTGSTCLTKDADNTFHKIGGCGYLLSDEGSGYDIGNKAIRRFITDASSGKKRSSLAENVLQFYGMADEQELISEIYASLRPHWLIASCAKTICDAADAGDKEANTHVAQAARDLLQMVETARKRINCTTSSKLTLTGSILSQNSVVRKEFDALLAAVPWQSEIVKLQSDPEVAALFQAIRTAGHEISAELFKKTRTA